MQLLGRGGAENPVLASERDDKEPQRMADRARPHAQFLASVAGEPNIGHGLPLAD